MSLDLDPGTSRNAQAAVIPCGLPNVSTQPIGAFPPALKVHREPRGVAVKLDNSKSVGAATKGDLSGQFSNFRL